VTRHGKHRKRLRGVHKNARSPETIRWEREQLIPQAPSWMPTETYTALARLRSELETGRA
jgi:hypothetical protein